MFESWRVMGERQTTRGGYLLLHDGRRALVVPGQSKVVALARHADGYAPDAGPRIKVGAEGVKGAVIRAGIELVANPSAARRSRPRWWLMDLWGGADAHRFGKRRPRAASLGEALQDLLAPRTETGT